MPLSRLVTWNHFFSASAYERDEPFSWSALEDFSSLVDLLCLYDNLVVIGDPEHPPFLTHTTDFFGAMRGSRAIDIRPPDPDALGDATRRHLRLLLPQIPRAALDSWLSQAFRLNLVPAERERVATMNAEIRLSSSPLLSARDPAALAHALADPEDPSALRPFVVRTFMYLAYSELAGVPFAADASRRPLVASAMACEADFAFKLIDTLRRQWQRFPAVGAIEARSRTSPFSALVLERCKGDRRAIPTEILELRDRLRPIRQRLAEFEQTIVSSEKRDDAIRAESKWSSILEEVDRSFGPSPRLVSFRSGLAVADAAGEILDSPGTPTSTIAAALKLPVDVAIRFFQRRPMSQLHQLRSELPGAPRLAAGIRSVFPEALPLLSASPRPGPRRR